MVTATEGPGTGLQGSMGIASSLRTNCKDSVAKSDSSKNSNSTCSLSLIESSSDIVSLYPSTEEVIAFGGIPKPTHGGRSSSRLGFQPNADMPQTKKAIKNAQLHDDSFNAGKFAIPKHSIINIPDSKVIERADRLGISLGRSEGEIGKSIKGLKMVEEEQFLTILKKKMKLKLRIRTKDWRLLFCQKYLLFVRI
jgi:hypothetical protein